ncbi:GGDEF domain-containing phosphodiesterase [Aestuariicoccus sp. MJ-SS9]|uniref:GGDEF domain-containing phosphodiesterase n=1 Tax=Aestuariicoccus sp. MJ-SS9 TaxID=3079855 RepID=UPI00291137DB|nr:GGDEF domain-containing phosphodiesterase [Aestuariicoccus sp. MJ-SS9]MDU8912236.1 GGDEF domain-containing phosphodiesterase [Aestuariicoccus sp. MJ-SS9]
MRVTLSAQARIWKTRLQHLLLGPQLLAFLPAIVLAAFWTGGEIALLIVALTVPVLFALSGGFSGAVATVPAAEQPMDLVDRATVASLTEQSMLRAQNAKLQTGAFLIEVEGLDGIARQMGEDAASALRELCLSRLRNLLRRDDMALRVGDSRYLVLLGPSLRLDLEAMLQMGSRFQMGVEEPADINGTTHYLSAAIGFCGSSRLPRNATGRELIDGTQAALAEAIANGPSAIRAWSESIGAERRARKALQTEVERALANGQIQAWFQPQICTSTGAISGVEALARWLHPERGVVPPGQFLRSLEEANQMERLSEVIVQQSLTALRGWDNARLGVPRVSVNFATSELRNPRLVERIKWELDRFGLTPQRLGIEVLETVIADAPDGIVARNIEALLDLGCHVDLDDFGTGHASITALRRFPVNRLKIDRSFVTRVDRDEEQRRMLTAVLSMADRLGLETLAEGVESVGEHALLSQLGCDHVQGFGIARPMPGDAIYDWAKTHAKRIASAQRLGSNTG